MLQNAARLLIRISANLEAFPAHAAAILTSTVVECHRQVAVLPLSSHLKSLPATCVCVLITRPEGYCSCAHHHAHVGSEFPAHLSAQESVGPLQSTSPICKPACDLAICRAGLAGAAYTHATRLMEPELKAALNPAYKRKIEGLVRRRER